MTANDTKDRATAVRWWKPADLPGLVELHAASFPGEDWTAADFRRFADRNAPGRANVLKVLADGDDRVLGSLLYTLDEGICRVRRVAVRPDARRRGLGTHALASLCGRHALVRCKTFLARVREDNTAGLLFFRNCELGFEFNAQAPRHVYEDGRQGLTFRLVKAPARKSVFAAC